MARKMREKLIYFNFKNFSLTFKSPIAPHIESQLKVQKTDLKLKIPYLIPTRCQSQALLLDPPIKNLSKNLRRSTATSTVYGARLSVAKSYIACIKKTPQKSKEAYIGIIPLCTPTLVSCFSLH